MNFSKRKEVSDEVKQKATKALSWLESKDGEKKFDKSYQAADQLTKSLDKKRYVDVSTMAEAVNL